jgi:Fe2+ or Zn2+ uptake regulation protein
VAITLVFAIDNRYYVIVIINSENMGSKPVSWGEGFSKIKSEDEFYLLKSKNSVYKMRLTQQARKIYEILKSGKGIAEHFTVEEIYAIAKKALPDLSLATVYFNLRKFKEMKAVRVITCDDGKVRFDADMRVHHHFFNSKTGELQNARLPKKIPIPAYLKRKGVHEIRVMYVI